MESDITPVFQKGAGRKIPLLFCQVSKRETYLYTVVLLKSQTLANSEIFSLPFL